MSPIDTPRIHSTLNDDNVPRTKIVTINAIAELNPLSWSKLNSGGVQFSKRFILLTYGNLLLETYLNV